MDVINSRTDALNNIENATGADNTTDDIGSDLVQDIIIFLIIHAKINKKEVLTPQELDVYYRIKKNFTKETSPEDIFMSKYYKYFTSIYNHAKTEIYKSDVKRIEKDIDNFILSLNQLNKSNNSLNIYTDEYLKSIGMWRSLLNTSAKETWHVEAIGNISHTDTVESQLDKSSREVAAEQRQQEKRKNPVVINAGTTNNTAVQNKNNTVPA
jgi:hypothetical protein